MTEQGTIQETARLARLRRRKFIGYAFAFFCLVWVLRSVDFSALGNHVSEINWKLVGAAILLDVLSYAAQGWRWSLLLRHTAGRLSIWMATRTIYAALFVNEILPMKIGEAVRGILAAGQLRTSFWRVLPTMLIERFFDGIWLVAGIAVTAFFVKLPTDLIKADEILGAIFILLIGFFFLLVGRSGAASEESHPENSAAPVQGEPSVNWRGKIRKHISDFGGQIRLAGTRKETCAAFFISLGLLLMQAVSFWLLLRAYRIEVPIAVGAAVFLIVQLGTALPGAPANIGSYQFFTVLGLTLFGIDKTISAEFSIVVFLLLTIPLWFLGFFALSASGTTLSALREEVGTNLRR